MTVSFQRNLFEIRLHLIYQKRVDKKKIEEQNALQRGRNY